MCSDQVKHESGQSSQEPLVAAALEAIYTDVLPICTAMDKCMLTSTLAVLERPVVARKMPLNFHASCSIDSGIRTEIMINCILFPEISQVLRDYEAPAPKKNATKRKLPVKIMIDLKISIYI